MDLVDYMGRVESVLSDYQIRISALEKAVTTIPQLTMQTDPTMPPVVVPDYSTQVAPAAAPMMAVA
jgi:GTP1/Obg family GTP-binding protein